MRRFWPDWVNSPQAGGIHPALSSHADDACATVAYLFAYAGALALLAILAIHLWDQLPSIDTDGTAPGPAWRIASHSHPAFALSLPDYPGKSISYTILRHPEGGRKDILRWTDEGGRPVAELEIYRLGGEFHAALPADSAVAAPMPHLGRPEPENAGLIDSKFGTVALLRQAGGLGAGACLGFFKTIDDPAVRISGWSCQGDTLPAQRIAIACMLNRLTLLTSGNDPKMAELFARAELKRGGCGASAAPPATADWLTAAENPRLRGTF